MRERKEFERRLLAARSLLTKQALTLTRNKDAAEDLLQSTMLRAIECWEYYNPALPINPWLVTIMWRLHIDTVRKTRITHELPDDDSGAKYLATEPAQLHHMALSELLTHIRTLPTEMSAALLLTGLYGLSSAEIAVKADVPRSTIKSRICRAKVRLGSDVVSLAVP